MDGTGDGRLSITAALTGGDMTKTGSGPLELAGANPGGMALTVAEGEVKVMNAGALNNVTSIRSTGCLVLAVPGGVFTGTLDFGSAASLPVALRVVSSCTLDAAISLESDARWAVESGTTFLHSGVISGTGGLTLTGSGITEFLGAGNSYRGATRVDSGTLRLNKSSSPAVSAILHVGNGVDTPADGSATVRLIRSSQIALGTDVFVESDGQLEIGAFSCGVNNLTLTGGLVEGEPAGLLRLYDNITNHVATAPSRIDVPLELVGHVASPRILHIDDGPAPDDLLILPSRTLAGGFRKTGAGTVAFSGGDYDWSTSTIAAGRVVFGDVAHVGFSTLTVDCSASVEFDPGSGFPQVNTSGTLVLCGSGVAGEGVLVALSVQHEGNLQLAGDVDVDVASSLVVHGRIRGTGGLRKLGFGTLTLAGTGDNTYGGATRVLKGTIELAQAGVAVPSLSLVVGTPLQPAVVHYAANDQVNADVEVYGGSTFNLDGHDDMIGSLTLRSGGDVQTGAGTLTIHDDLSVLPGDIPPGTPDPISHVYGRLGLFIGVHQVLVEPNSNPWFEPQLILHATVVGPGSLRKQGAGILRLDGANTFSGAVTVNEGVLGVAHPNALGSSAAGVSVHHQAVLELFSGSMTIENESLVLDSTGQPNKGALYSNAEDEVIAWTGPVTLSVDTVVSVRGSLVLNGAILGSGGLTKTGDGLLYLSGSADNTYWGPTVVNQGELRLSKAGGANAISAGSLTIGAPSSAVWVRYMNNSQLSSAVPITLQLHGTLHLNGYVDDIGPLLFTGGDLATGSGQATLNGDVTACASTGVASRISGQINLPATRTFTMQEGASAVPLVIDARVIGLGGLTKTGSAELDLAGPNAFFGVTTVAEGVLGIQDSLALGRADSGTVVNSGASLALRVSELVVLEETLTLNGPGVSPEQGALSSAGSEPNVWGGDVVLATDTAIGVEGLAGELFLRGVVRGTGSVTKVGPGKLAYAGSGANTYSGDTILRSGVLVLEKTGGNAVSGGTLRIGDGADGGLDIVRLERDSQIGLIPIVITSSGRLYLNNHDDTVGPITFHGGRIETGTGVLGLGTDAIVTAMDDAGESDVALISGNVYLTSGAHSLVTHGPLRLTAEVSGAGGLVKTGSGMLMLTHSNSFTGPVTVGQGALSVSDAHGLGSADQGTTVNSDAQLVMSGLFTVEGEALTLGSGGGAATLRCNGGTNGWLGTITLNEDADLVAEPSQARLVLDGPLGGPGGFTKKGAGVLSLVGSHPCTYGGATRVNNGVLHLASSVHNSLAPGDLIIGDGVGGADADVVRLAAPHPQIADVTRVILNGSGLLDLSGTSGGPDDMGTHEVIGSLEGTGHVELGNKSLAVGQNDTSTLFSGRITGVGGSFRKRGNGTLTLTGPNSYTGDTRIVAGGLAVNGAQPQSAILIDAGGTLSGAGTVGPLVSAGGRVSPGLSPGVLTGGTVGLDSASTLAIELEGDACDQLNILGDVALGGASLLFSAGTSYPAEGQEYVILNNDGAEAVSGTFAGLAEGALVSCGLYQFHLTYAGGNGNDVALIATNTIALMPVLSLALTPTNTVAITWWVAGDAWRLQTASEIVGAGEVWTDLAPPYQNAGTNYLYVESAMATNRFFRLRRP